MRGPLFRQEGQVLGSFFQSVFAPLYSSPQELSFDVMYFLNTTSSPLKNVTHLFPHLGGGGYPLLPPP